GCCGDFDAVETGRNLLVRGGAKKEGGLEFCQSLSRMGVPRGGLQLQAANLCRKARLGRNRDGADAEALGRNQSLYGRGIRGLKVASFDRTHRGFGWYK